MGCGIPLSSRPLYTVRHPARLLLGRANAAVAEIQYKWSAPVVLATPTSGARARALNGTYSAHCLPRLCLSHQVDAAMSKEIPNANAPGTAAAEGGEGVRGRGSAKFRRHGGQREWERSEVARVGWAGRQRNWSVTVLWPRVLACSPKKTVETNTEFLLKRFVKARAIWRHRRAVSCGLRLLPSGHVQPC